ncbi:MAG: 6-carboxytetrahydropterin synthase [candidate division Zixibacteria bacterium]|nr:6-carboxytetrahydropterin synthase [candidate division Zixibacteria bacterium]
MYATLSKRFELSLSRQLYQAEWTQQKNSEHYGSHEGSLYGTGLNPIAYFIFHGPVDPKTGMMINISEVKKKINEILDTRYDHKFLNKDTQPFTRVQPTAEHLAIQLLFDVIPLFADSEAKPVACHLSETPDSEVTAYIDGRIERHFWIDFSAARRTFSPNLSDKENQDLFGIASAPSGHGHNYRLRITLSGGIDAESGQIVSHETIDRVMTELRSDLDHKNLNVDLPDLSGMPITTEVIARYLHARLSSELPLDRVRLYEMESFFAEYTNRGEMKLGLRTNFHAAHRLQSKHLSESENALMFGKCNNPNGHGHHYQVETTIAGTLDERSGTLFNFLAFKCNLGQALAGYAYKHLDLESEDFIDRPSTGENIIESLWKRCETSLGNQLERLRLWETPNNRFTLRRHNCMPKPASK